jgi:signal transduction histidine kinase
MGDQLADLLELIHFTEKVSTQLYENLDESEVWSSFFDAFRRSRKYTASVVLLNEDRTKLRVRGTSIGTRLVRKLERATKLRLLDFAIDLDRSRVYSKVIREGATAQSNVGDVISEFLPGPIALLVTRAMGFDKKQSVISPLRRRSEIIGALAMSSTDMAEHLIPSVRNLAQHLSTALLLAREQRNRERAEEHLVWSQKMETIGRVAGGVAHEFNNILITIKGYAELGLADPDRSAAMSRNLRKITRGVDRASELVDQLLTFARRQNHQPKLIDLNDVLSELIDVLRGLMGDRIDFRTELAPDLAPVRADPAKIEHVVINLALNSRDAMPDGGRLTITTKNVRHGPDDPGKLSPGEYVTFSVRDTGRGMSPEVMQHLFEPFFSTKELGKGTGLGLATCYGIIKERQGEIAVTSRPGRGTTFRVYLPRAVGHEESIAKPAV